MSQVLQHVTVADIQHAVAARYNVSISDMCSARRHLPIVQPRFMAIYLARTLTRLSLPAIGRMFGHRDHSVILRAVRVIRQQLKDDAALADELAALQIEALKRTHAIWRARMPAAALAFDQQLNEFGFELAIVPLGSRDENGFARKEITTFNKESNHEAF